MAPGERRGRRHVIPVTTTFEVHPAVGIARAGTSAQFFIGPEPGSAPPAKFRDPAGHLLRQAARFRIFRCERRADGTLKSATELTAADAKIEWTVHLVNRKGAAPESPPLPSNTPLQGGRLRNAKQKDPAKLVIDPGARTVAGAGGQAAFDSGTFLGTEVPLGEVRTDADGRLLVLGGVRTVGLGSRPQALPISHFANNDNWFDDLSDGPVRATVRSAGPVQSRRSRRGSSPPLPTSPRASPTW